MLFFDLKKKSRIELEPMKPIMVCYLPGPLRHLKNVLGI